MPEFTPITLSASSSTWIADVNQMMTDISNAVNTHHQELLVSVGAGAALIVDEFDRDGIVGSYSYVLDIENYSGGASIAVGRRPAPVVARGETDTSILWGNFGSGFSRVTQVGDVSPSFAGFLTGLPKTVYIGVGASGTSQAYEDQSDGNVVYIYSMTWDGFNLTSFKRHAPILPGYTLIQEMAAEPRILQVCDQDTDWVTPGTLDSETEIVTLGDPLDNEIDINGQVEVLGMFIHAHRGQTDDGWNAPASNAPESLVTLKLVSAAVDWTDDIEIDCGQVPDSLFVEIASAVGDLVYVNEVRRFRLELVSIGSGVTSARGFTWGLIARPIFGAPVAKDATDVEVV
jgi:hypothetical protein